MTQMLFCGFKNIFTSNKSQLPNEISSPVTASNNPLPFPSKNQGSSNKTGPKKKEEKTQQLSITEFVKPVM